MSLCFLDMLVQQLLYLWVFVILQSAHERWSDWYHFSMTQKSLVLQGWQRDRSELLLRALSVLEDCRISRIQQQELQNQRSHQQNICLKLREKVFTFTYILRH